MTITGSDRSRYLIHWKHNSNFLQNWRLSIDYTRVSDKSYFTDLSSSYGNSTDDCLCRIREFHIAYYQPNYYVAISAKAVPNI